MESFIDPPRRDQAMRFNSGKIQWSLVDFRQLEGMVKVLEFGMKKYDRDNWKKGLPMRSQCESMMRHLVALMSGEINDPETGLPHWSHIQCNAMFMGHTMENHPEMNDLSKKEDIEKESGSTVQDLKTESGSRIGMAT